MDHLGRSGREICRDFYEDVVAPRLASDYAALPYAAALLGRGSEVQGFDDAMSADHNLEARVLIFLSEDDARHHGNVIEARLRAALPTTYADRPTHVEVLTIDRFLQARLGISPDGDHPLTAADWLTIEENNLRMITSGPIFHDDLDLTERQRQLAFYPHDVWLYLMLAAWWRLHPEANLVGRTGWVGDELGSAVIGARLVRNLMRLAFLQERQYAPYAKWFGTAFSRLECAASLGPQLAQVLQARDWHEREAALIDCYRVVAANHDRLQVTPPVDTGTTQLWDRPFRVFWGDFPGALRQAITDPEVIDIADRWPVGAVDDLREAVAIPRFQPGLAALVREG
jgi:hypothetical protein